MTIRDEMTQTLFGRPIREMEDEEIQVLISELRSKRSERSSATREKSKKKNKLIRQVAEGTGQLGKIAAELKDLPPEVLEKIKALLDG